MTTKNPAKTMQNILNDLVETLKKDDRLVVEGRLIKNKVVEMALALDPDLLKLLLGSEQTKKHFFQNIDGVLIFDKVEFQRFVSNKQFLPDSYTAFKNKIGLAAQGEYLSESKEVVLVWPYKDCVLEGGQTKEDQKRDEIFWNTTLAPDRIDRLLEPKVLSNFKRYDKTGEKEVSSISLDDNLVIKGNNLLALESLKKVYTGMVKLIYIDPPYNTASDSFRYNDSFTHSSWLTFMRNRIESAQDLLATSGVICINIDDKELYHLKVLCDEVLGRTNYLNTIVVKTSDPSGHKVVNPSPYSQTEYILMYAKNKGSYKYETYFVLSEYDEGYNQYLHNRTAPPSQWKISGLNEHVASLNGYDSTRQANEAMGKPAFYSAVAKFALENRDSVFQKPAIADDAAADIRAARDQSKENRGIVFQVDRPNGAPVYVLDGRQVYFYSNKVRTIDGVTSPAKPLTNIWTDIPYNGIGGEGGVTLKNGKKPEKLLRRIIEICTSPGDIVLDYHLGSGTCAAVAHKLGRRYIGLEQLDYGSDDSTVRLRNVISGDATGVSDVLNWKGGGSFVYAELAKSNAAFLVEIASAKTKKALAKVWSNVSRAGFLSHRVNLGKLTSHAVEYDDLSLEEQKKFIMETLDMNHLYINYSEMDDKDHGVTQEVKKLNHLFYSLR